MTTRNTKLAVAGVALMLLSVVSFAAPAFGAAPTIDTETTDTTSTSDMTDTTVVTNFDANASQNISTLEASYDSQNPGVRILDPDRDNVTLNSFDEADMVQTGTASGTYYYSLTMDEGDFKYAETDALENKTVYIQLVNNTQSDDPDLTNISIELEETAGRTVRVVGDTTSGLEAFSGYEIAGFSLSLPYFSGSSQADFETTSLPTSENGTVILHAQNSTLTDQLGAFDSYAEETPITGMSVTVDGENIPIYTSSAPSDVEGAYAVADLSSNDLELHGIDDSSADVSLSTTGIAPWTSISLYGWGQLNPLSAGGFASGMGLFLFGSFGRRRTEA